jgi:Protease inhibitor Inh
MHISGSALRAIALLSVLSAGGCGGDRMAGLEVPGSGAAPATAQRSAPAVNMAGRWLLSSPGRGQCHMTFGAASPTASEGPIRPEGGCPGKFFTSRKWTFEQGSLVMRDHNEKPLAQLAATGAGFDGKATTGEPVTLLH